MSPDFANCIFVEQCHWLNGEVQRVRLPLSSWLAGCTNFGGLAEDDLRKAGEVPQHAADADQAVPESGFAGVDLHTVGTPLRPHLRTAVHQAKLSKVSSSVP